ncbi:MAG: hypothetical protein D3904_09955 [Candidatus Electrothrix sp. EH2]|nr:hypothetical protein [Candidatus Electrothrix sp. EH2]
MIVFLTKSDYEMVLGPLKRAIQRYIEDPLALEVLESRFSEGIRCVLIRGEKNRLMFSRK